MTDYISEIKSKDNKISILQNLVEKNDGHVSRLKNMIEQLKKQLKFEQEKNSEITRDMNKLRETIQTQNQKIRDLQESLFQSKENERQLHTRIKDLKNQSPQRHQRFHSITKTDVEQGRNNQTEDMQFPQDLGRKSMQDFSKYEEASPLGRYQLNPKNSNSPFVPQIQVKIKKIKKQFQNHILIIHLSKKQRIINTQNEQFQIYQSLAQFNISSESQDKSTLSQSDNTSTNSEYKRRSPNLRIDSSVIKSQQSFSESPKIQKAMLNMVEEDLNNIMISAQYQRELDPHVLKTLAKSIVAIKYTSKVMEHQVSIPCISEVDDECDDLYISKNIHESTMRNKQDSMSEKNQFKIKLNQIEQDEINQIEIRKKKSSSISEKTARISFQPKGQLYNANSKQLNLQFNQSEEKQSDNVNSCIQKRISLQNNISDGQDLKSNSNPGSQNILPSNQVNSMQMNQIQEQIDINQEIKIEIQKDVDAGEKSEGSSAHNSPKCSEDSDMYQPFSHFFVLGCDKNDLQEYDKLKADRVLLPGKLLYSYSDRITSTKNDPFEQNQIKRNFFQIMTTIKQIFKLK